MYYSFKCPNCGNKERIWMKMSEMHNDGHMCGKCGTELKREISDMVCGMSKDNTGDFYRSVN